MFTKRIINGFLPAYGFSYNGNCCTARVKLEDANGVVVEKSVPFKIVQNFSVSVSTEKAIYDRDEIVLITGHAQYPDESPVPNAPVVLSIKGDYTHTYSLVTGSDGSFYYYFNPSYSEAGNFTVGASVISEKLWRSGETSFKMYGLYMTPSGIIDYTMSKNSSEELTFTLKNFGDSALHGVTVDIVDENTGDGVDYQIVQTPALTLAPNAQQYIKLKITAGKIEISKANFSISVTTDEGSHEEALLKVHLVEAVPIAFVNPTYITAGMNPENIQVRTVNVSNFGYESLKNVNISKPNLDWISTTSTGLGSITPYESKSFDIILHPSNDTAPGVYQDNITISSSNHNPVKIYLTISVTSSQQGDLLFHVINDIGENISGASITIQNQDVFTEVFKGTTNKTGYYLFDNISIGRYTYIVKASGHDSISNSITVSPEIQTLVEPVLLKNILGVQLTVTPITIGDTYDIQLNLTFETEVPPPILVPSPLYISYGVNFTDPEYENDGSITISNPGLISIFNVTVNSSLLAGVNISFPTGTSFLIDEIKAKSSVTIPYHLNVTSVYCGEDSRRNNIIIRGDYIYFEENSDVTHNVYVSSEIPVFISMYNCPVSSGPTLLEQLEQHFTYSYHPPGGSYSPGGTTSPTQIQYVETVRERVKLSISQQATLERDAFGASLELTNKLADKSIENVKASLEIKDKDGGDASGMFFVNQTFLNNINSIDGSGVIDPYSIATADWLLIPTPGAGGTTPAGKDYTVQAFIDYSVDGVPFSVNSTEENINVMPQPLLNLTYLIPGEVKADTPFNLTLNITNVGYGVARNLKLDSAQPMIYENKAGLLVSFKLIGSGIVGGTEGDSMLINFGDIAPGQSKEAYWIMTASLDGEFTEFKGSFSHSNALGGAETSLIKNITYLTVKPLTIRINTPENFKTYEYNGQSLLFNASIAGGISPYSYYWNSDVDGDLSSTENTYKSIDTFEKELSPETHIISVKVTDGLGNKAEQRSRIYVERINLYAKIITPYSNSCFNPAEPVKFEGTATKGVPPYKFTWISDVDGILKETIESYKTTDSFSRQLPSGARTITLKVTDNVNSISESSPVRIIDDFSECSYAEPLTGGLISMDRHDPTIVTLDSTLYFYHKTRPGSLIEMELIKPDNSIEPLIVTANEYGIATISIEFLKYKQEGEFIVYLKRINDYYVTPIRYYINALPQVFSMDIAVIPEKSGSIGIGKSVGVSTEINDNIKLEIGAGVSDSFKKTTSLPKILRLNYKGSNVFNDNEILSSNADISSYIENEGGNELEAYIGASAKVYSIEITPLSVEGSIYGYNKDWDYKKYSFGTLNNEENWRNFRTQSPIILLNPNIEFWANNLGTSRFKVEEGIGSATGSQGTIEAKIMQIRKGYDEIGGYIAVTGEREIGQSFIKQIDERSTSDCIMSNALIDVSSGFDFSRHTWQGRGRPTNEPTLGFSSDLFNLGVEKSVNVCAFIDNNGNPLVYSVEIGGTESYNILSNGRSSDEKIELISTNPEEVNSGPIKDLFDFHKQSDIKSEIHMSTDRLLNDLNDNLDNQKVTYIKKEAKSASNSYGFDLDASLVVELGGGAKIETVGTIDQEIEKGFLKESNNQNGYVIYRKPPSNLEARAISDKFFWKLVVEAIKQNLVDIHNLYNEGIKEIDNKLSEIGSGLTQGVNSMMYGLESIQDRTVIYISQIIGYDDVHIHVIDQYGREVYYDYNNKSYINHIPGAQLYTNISLNDKVIKDFIILPNTLKFNIYVDANEAHNETEPYNLTLVTGYHDQIIGTIINDNITKGTIKQFYINFIEVNNNLTINISDPSPYICGNGLADPNETIINCPLDLDTQPPKINEASLDLIHDTIIVKVNASDNAIQPLAFLNVNSSTGNEDIPIEYNISSDLYQIELIPIQSDIFNFKVKIYDNINHPPVERELNSKTIKRNVSSAYLKGINITTPYTVEYYQDGEGTSEIEAFRPFDIVFTLYNGRVEFKDVIAKRINPFNLPTIYPALNVTLHNQTFIDTDLENNFIEIDNLSVQNYLGDNATYTTKIKLNKFGNTISALKCDSLLFGECINEEVIPASNYFEENEQIILNQPHFSSYGLVYEMVEDTAPPSSIYDIDHEAGNSSILWKWTKLFEPDFNHTEIYLNGIFIENISVPQNFYNAKGLIPNTLYEISTRTVDVYGNINKTWINDTAITSSITEEPTDITPLSVTNLHSSSGPTWLNFTWTNPYDLDFNHTILYLNGAFLTNVSAPQNYYNITGLTPDTDYELGTHTADTSGNINTTWKNATARTLAAPDNAPPVITNVSAVPANDSAVITWDTDEASDSLVKYGASPGTQLKDNGMVFKHLLALSGLEPNTDYYYFVNSTDASGNSAQSSEHTFRTLEIPDTMAPVIGTVESYPVIAYAGAVINVSAVVSDNKGVASVTLNNIAIENIGSDLWAGSFTVPASAAVGNYAVTLKALDAAGNSAQMQVNYSVVIKGGGVSISSSPKPLVVSPGSSGVVNIKLSSTATFDEVVNVTISTIGLSNASAVNLSWFNRTTVIVNIPKGKIVSIPFKVSVPSSTVSGYKAFKDSAKSLGLNSTSMETGSINVKP